MVSAFGCLGRLGLKQRRGSRRGGTPRYRTLPVARSGSFAGALLGGLRNARRCLIRLLGDLAKLESAQVLQPFSASRELSASRYEEARRVHTGGLLFL